MMKKAAIFG
jgi:hypothetical protein